jgi:hypothetical protein
MKRAAKRPRLVACRHPKVWRYWLGSDIVWCRCGAAWLRQGWPAYSLDPGEQARGGWRLPARTRSTARGKR